VLDYDFATRLRIESNIRIADPVKFNGKSVQKHTEFVRTCEGNFRAKPITYGTHKAKVLYASQFLEGDPAREWTRYEEDHGRDCILWETFKELLLDWVRTPRNRHIDAAKKFEEAQQGNSTVRYFNNYLKELEDRLPPYSEEHRKQHFMTKIRPDLRRQILQMEHMPDTREAMVEAAARFEEDAREERQEKSNGVNTQAGKRNKKDWSSKDRRETPKEDESSSSTSLKPPTNPNNIPVRTNPSNSQHADLTCYNCQKKGHIAPDCTAPKRPMKARVAAARRQGKD
jgi:hypothetical protein